MTHDRRLRAMEAHVSKPVVIGSLLDEPCGWCGSSPVRLRILLRDGPGGRTYPPPVGMVGCAVCKNTGFSQATFQVGEQEGWFEPGGWVYEHYAAYPMTEEHRTALRQTREEAREAAQAAGGEP